MVGGGGGRWDGWEEAYIVTHVVTSYRHTYTVTTVCACACVSVFTCTYAQ